MTTQSIIKIAEKCENYLNLDRTDPNKAFPKSLPICILEAIFSMAAHSTSSTNVRTRYEQYYSLNFDKQTGIGTIEHTVSEFIKNIDSFKSIEDFTEKVLKNRQRTSAKSGILKAEAAYEVAKVFEKHKINTIADFQKYPAELRDSLNQEICLVRGQSSGIMLKYLYMLAGDENNVKPDRMLLRFIKEIEPEISIDEVQETMEKVVATLKKKHPQLTVRLVDFLIWDYQRSL